MKRVCLTNVVAGRVVLLAAEAHHVRDVLRLGVGDAIEVFDQSGRRAQAAIVEARQQVVVEVGEVQAAAAGGLEWTVGSGIPKGARADWMIEKLSELGAARFVPLHCERSVVIPGGQGKIQRWQRIATESAKQSGRAGVMRIEPMVTVAQLLGAIRRPAWYLSTAGDARPARQAADELIGAGAEHLTMLIGPEGDWSDVEVSAMENAGLTGVSLGATILRVETAAVVAGAIVAAIVSPAIKERS